MTDDLNRRRNGTKVGMKEKELVVLMKQLGESLVGLHNLGWAHLDIKPDNIFIKINEAGEVKYILGDLGHAIKIGEETEDMDLGDCRYMAQELLNNPDSWKLDKADMFSLGITLYEAASLLVLPKNSSDVISGSPSYESLKDGNLPHLESFTDKFNGILRACVNSVLEERLGAKELVESVIAMDDG